MIYVPNTSTSGSESMIARICPTVARIQVETCGHYGLSLISMTAQRRDRSVARPRQVAMFLAKELTEHSLPTIGRLFKRDHTTVLHAVRTVEALISVDPRLERDVEFIRARIADRLSTIHPPFSTASGVRVSCDLASVKA